MQIGKIDNASASYIDPTAKAMRAGGKRLARKSRRYVNPGAATSRG